ncbi:MAG: hypothetical protein A4S09_15865 [Proteobacteria bacterium SG_bin7]|nr:MAG: hypothetical protein A4S09_15865 [Proteobacteria bacterium SG_bin7]
MTELLDCPKCRKAISEDKGSLKCSNCKITFPNIHGIPWLFRSPESILIQWQARTTKLLQMCLVQSAQIEQELLKVDLLSETKDRLKTLKKAILENEKFLQEFLADLWPDKNPKTVNFAVALEEKVGATQTLESYFNNIFRDWSWDSGENEKALKCVSEILPKNFRPKTMVVLGSGAGRLTYDLHNKLKCEHTIAVDINPLLMFLFKDIMAGEVHQLWEIPISPMKLENVAKKQNLKFSKPTAKGISYLFTDASNLPFKDKSLDVVLTPWFVDIVKQDLRFLAQRINRALAMDGHWVNFGPLGFQHFENSENYTVEEVRKILTEEGFEISDAKENVLPYLSSPYSGMGRSETVVSFIAKKKKEAKEPSYYSPLPDWITDFKKPIQPDRDLKYEIARYHLGFQILNCIDGKTSADTITALIAKHYGVSLVQAKEIVTGFLIEKFEK